MSKGTPDVPGSRSVFEISRSRSNGQPQPPPSFLARGFGPHARDHLTMVRCAVDATPRSSFEVFHLHTRTIYPVFRRGEDGVVKKKIRWLGSNEETFHLI